MIFPDFTCDFPWLHKVRSYNKSDSDSPAVSVTFTAAQKTTTMGLITVCVGERVNDTSELMISFETERAA